MSATLFNLVAGPAPLIILAVVIFFFGGRKIPALARALRDSLGEFRRGRKEGLTDDRKPSDDPHA